MKRAIYFEDLQKDVFVIKVVDSKGNTFLEQRKWLQNDYERTPGDEFDKVRLTCKLDQAAQYGWIDDRSVLQGVSEDTARWTDRSWSLP